MTFIASAEAQAHAAQQATLATPEGRYGFAVYIAQVEINGLLGLEDFVTGILKHLAGQHADEERHARFEELKDAVRSGNPGRIEGAVHRLAEAAPTRRNTTDITPDTSLPRCPRLACEADTEETNG